jgi:4-hydroxythreonine-4-phosphate dehydrogenase
LKKVAISIGDLNGIGLELAIRNHKKISKFVEPTYLLNLEMLKQGSELLNLEIPKGFQVCDEVSGNFRIDAGEVSKESGKYSFDSFRYGVELAKDGYSLLTLPVNKMAWNLAGIPYKGHTDALRDIFKKDAIMMMGVPEMYVALFTEHIPLSKVIESVSIEKLVSFLRNFSKYTSSKVGVLGVNPHAGDGGVLGNEENILEIAIEKVNLEVGKELFSKPLVPDVAFTPAMRKEYNYFVAIYHDQGLAPLKALYFDEVINISLNLPIQRVSVGHGTAFDIAYKKDRTLNSKSYLNSIKYLL